MGKLTGLVKKGVDTIKNEGGIEFTKKTVKYVYHRQFPDKKQREMKDILFVNGCALPHPARYRVDHQVEQLIAAGMTAESVFYEDLNLSMLKNYQAFVFFRCPVTDTVREFIAQAQYFNKTCFYDIDDLVIDQKYTDKNQYVSAMSKSDKALYDDGVDRMRETLTLCDYAITSTERLRTELSHYIKEVFINRNVASSEMVRYSQELLKGIRRDPKRVVLGYFSGSITHNEDFALITPALVQVMEKHSHVYLKVAGMLDVPAELEPFRDRVVVSGFTDWKKLPRVLASCDINLAPLTDTVFNEAKSENKWTEAALVKVPTIASDFGAFRKVINSQVTGVLVKNPEDWVNDLNILVEDLKMRTRIGEAAYHEVMEKHTTIANARNLADIIKSKLHRSVAFVLPTTDISGGVTVILKHAEILRKNGWNVTLIDDIHKKALKNSLKQYDYRLEIAGYNVVMRCNTKIEAYFDTMVATLWTTLKGVKEYPTVKNRLYLVQGFETEFAAWGSDGMLKANATYFDDTDVRYITISMWCRQWLHDKFGKDARYAPNGLEINNYPVRKRDFSGGKIKILIEGDSRSELKNTDEAFRIVEKLDKKHFHISYLSYRKEPKSWYRVDKFYNRISPEKVGEIYSGTDILIKTSLREGFSYPPLEMMATGGLAVVVPNDGNREYLVGEENCLLYEAGDIDAGVNAVERLVTDTKLRSKLIRGGLKTARRYDWAALEKRILELYQ